MSNTFRVRPMKGYEKTHLITDDGRVFRKTRIGGATKEYESVSYHKGVGYPFTIKYVTKTLRGRWLKPQFNGKYYHIMTASDRKCNIIHQLVAKTFIPNPSRKPHINHKDGDKLNNDVSNLEWCTPSENAQHAYDTGLNVAKIGDARHNTRIPEKELARIKTLRRNGFSQKEIGSRYGVDQSHISRIVNNHRRGRITSYQT